MTEQSTGATGQVALLKDSDERSTRVGELQKLGHCVAPLEALSPPFGNCDCSVIIGDFTRIITTGANPEIEQSSTATEQGGDSA